MQMTKPTSLNDQNTRSIYVGATGRFVLTVGEKWSVWGPVLCQGQELSLTWEGRAVVGGRGERKS